MFCAEEKMWLISVFYSPCFSYHEEHTEASWLECSEDYKLVRREEKLFGTPLGAATLARRGASTAVLLPKVVRTKQRRTMKKCSLALPALSLASTTTLVRRVLRCAFSINQLWDSHITLFLASKAPERLLCSGCMPKPLWLHRDSITRSYLKNTYYSFLNKGPRDLHQKREKAQIRSASPNQDTNSAYF